MHNTDDAGDTVQQQSFHLLLWDYKMGVATSESDLVVSYKTQHTLNSVLKLS